MSRGQNSLARRGRVVEIGLEDFWVTIDNRRRIRQAIRSQRATPNPLASLLLLKEEPEVWYYWASEFTVEVHTCLYEKVKPLGGLFHCDVSHVETPREIRGVFIKQYRVIDSVATGSPEQRVPSSETDNVPASP